MRTPTIEFNSPKPPKLADLLTFNPPPPLHSKFILVYIIILLILTLSKFPFFLLSFIVNIKTNLFRIPIKDDIMRRMRLPIT